jgi:hypothetical protein
MTTAPTKRSVGRPRKNAKKQENPDCEVATKGFVKCVARNVVSIEHTHKILHKGDLTASIGAVTLISTGISLLLYLFAFRYGVENMQALFAPIFWMSLVILVGCLCSTNSHLVEAPLSDTTPDYLKKHEEPPCEPKRGCEGE